MASERQNGHLHLISFYISKSDAKKIYRAAERSSRSVSSILRSIVYHYTDDLEDIKMFKDPLPTKPGRPRTRFE